MQDKTKIWGNRSNFRYVERNGTIIVLFLLRMNYTYRRPLYILTKYLETGKVRQNIRGINPSFHCPDSFTVEHECFLSYLSECGLAIATNQTLLGYTRKFILFLENRGVYSSEHIET